MLLTVSMLYLYAEENRGIKGRWKQNVCEDERQHKRSIVRIGKEYVRTCAFYIGIRILSRERGRSNGENENADAH